MKFIFVQESSSSFLILVSKSVKTINGAPPFIRGHVVVFITNNSDCIEKRVGFHQKLSGKPIWQRAEIFTKPATTRPMLNVALSSRYHKNSARGSHLATRVGFKNLSTSKISNAKISDSIFFYCGRTAANNPNKPYIVGKIFGRRI